MDNQYMYELYTLATSLYLCLVLALASIMLIWWISQGWGKAHGVGLAEKSVVKLKEEDYGKI